MSEEKFGQYVQVQYINVDGVLMGDARDYSIWSINAVSCGNYCNSTIFVMTKQGHQRDLKHALSDYSWHDLKSYCKGKNY